MSNKLYAERDIEGLDEDGNFYFKHVMAMTSENLQGKSAIAAELGYRDSKIVELQARLEHATNQRDNALAQNAELVVMVEALRIAALNAIQRMPGGEAKADLRDAYDATPAQHLRERDAESYKAGWLDGYNQEDCFINPDVEAAAAANQYAEKVRMGEV